MEELLMEKLLMEKLLVELFRRTDIMDGAPQDLARAI